jgi:hypothetical protein
VRYIRVYLPLSLVGEDETVTGSIALVVDTEASSPGNAVIARCVDGVVAQAIADALNA